VNGYPDKRPIICFFHDLSLPGADENHYIGILLSRFMSTKDLYKHIEERFLKTENFKLRLNKHLHNNHEIDQGILINKDDYSLNQSNIDDENDIVFVPEYMTETIENTKNIESNTSIFIN